MHPPVTSPPSRSDLLPHRGGMILVMGILGIVICAPLAIVAWVMGQGDLGKIRSGMMDPAGQGTTQAGMILGIVGTILFILSIVAVVLLLAAGLLLPAVARSAQ